MRISIIGLMIVAFSIATHISMAGAQLNQLAIRVPDAANALVVINAKAAYASQFAKAQGWNSGERHPHRDGMISLPAQVDKFLMAAEVDFEFMQPLWEVAVAHVRDMPAIEDIASRSGGKLDRIAGAEAVERPNDSVVVTLGPKVIGAFSPANRQQVNRWVRDSRRRKSAELSPYLADALLLAEQPSNHILLAFDLQGLLAPADVATRLANQDSQLAVNADLESVANVAASIVGASLAVQLRDPAHGRLELRFSEKAEVITSVAKPLLLAMLSERGAEITGLNDWVVSSEGKTITLSGSLTPSGLRRILSVLSSPVGPMAARITSATSADEAVAKASQVYFQKVTGYLDDLFINGDQPASLYQAKLWIDRYARKIDDLDTYELDNEVVAFGQDVSALLYEIVNALDRSERRSDSREANLYDSGRRRYGRYGAYGYFEKSYVARDRELVQSDEANRGLQETKVIVDELRDLSVRTRAAMTKKYDLPF